MSIDFQNVFYTYSPKTPLSYSALKGIDLHIDEGSFVAIVGRTGCGKSTLVQHINGLLIPQDGTVAVDEFLLCSDRKKRTKKIKPLRKKVGLVFQFSEYQLFEETVLKDVAFGPKNFGASEEEAKALAKEALAKVGLSESFYERSPFELSGGEKRRVAIAGILAMQPSYLVVDEPTAGLDPLGAEELMSLFSEINKSGTTIILVTHDMNLVLSHCQTVFVIDDGIVVKRSDPVSLFLDDVEKYSLETPALFKFAKALKENGMDLDLGSITDVDSLCDQIVGLGKR